MRPRRRRGSSAGPMVRIRLPPALSHVRTRLPRSVGRLASTCGYHCPLGGSGLHMRAPIWPTRSAFNRRGWAQGRTYLLATRSHHRRNGAASRPDGRLARHQRLQQGPYPGSQSVARCQCRIAEAAALRPGFLARARRLPFKMTDKCICGKSPPRVPSLLCICAGGCKKQLPALSRGG